MSDVSLLRIECPDCGELRSSDECILVDDALCLRCERCDTSSRAKVARPAQVAANASAKPSASLASDELRCPKCQEAVALYADACPHCGLRRAKFEDFQSDSEGSDELGSEWQVLESDFHKAEAHEQFLKAVAAKHAYREAARRYRQKGIMSDGEISQKMLERLQSMASVAIVTRTKVERPKPAFQGSLVLLILLLMGAASVGGYLLVKGKKAKERAKGTARAPGSTLVPAGASSRELASGR